MTYSFKCMKCGEVFDISESLAVHDKHQEACPKCGSKELQQQFGSVQVQTTKKT